MSYKSKATPVTIRCSVTSPAKVAPMPMFDPDTGKLIDRDALKSVGFGMTPLREPGTANAAPKKVKREGSRAKPSPGYP